MILIIRSTIGDIFHKSDYKLVALVVYLGCAMCKYFTFTLLLMYTNLDLIYHLHPLLCDMRNATNNSYQREHNHFQILSQPNST